MKTEFDAGRSADWRESLDSQGRPTHGPSMAANGCDYCDGAVNPDGVCEWCIARFPARSIASDW